MKSPIRKNRKEKPYQPVFAIILIAAGVLLISSFAWERLTKPEPENVTEKTETSHPADNAEKKQIQAASQPKPERNQDLPLSLIGTSIQDNNSSFAVIRDKVSGEQHLVRKGDTIQKAVLAEIQPDSVLLRMGTSEKILHLEKAVTDEHSIEPSIGSEPVQTPPYPPEEIAARYNHEEDIKEVMGLMDQIDFSPSPENGETKGVVIRRIQQNSIFEKIGLKVDDMIISIDEKKIETLDDSFEIYETLRTSSKGSILIERNNVQETLFYQNEIL
ncbi:MAG: PDZ domain-containing protein [Desulfobacteraceae bacterium]|nr:MAG: PDZ domain-containing protein [Desulfobacteraceae bacterium]